MESPYYEMIHDFEEENRLFQSGYVKGYHDAVMKCSDIVRCKDCKHHGEWSCAVCINELFETAGNWYCADGERK